MKVGLIGLGRMGEGMSRRMLKTGIEVYGYRRNVAKAEEAAANGYITAARRFSGKPCSSSTPRRSRWQSSWDLSTRYPSRTSRGHTR